MGGGRVRRRGWEEEGALTGGDGGRKQVGREGGRNRREAEEEVEDEDGWKGKESE